MAIELALQGLHWSQASQSFEDMSGPASCMTCSYLLCGWRTAAGQPHDLVPAPQIVEFLSEPPLRLPLRSAVLVTGGHG